MNRFVYAFMVLASVFPVCGHAQTQAASDGNPPVGINLAGVSYWSTELPFVDIFKISQPLVSQKKGAGYGKGDKHELRDDGYPKQLLPDHHMDSITAACNGHYPGGDYICLYDGKGKLEFAFDAKAVKQEPGRAELSIVPKDQVAVRIMQTDPADPIRNIRLVPKPFEKTYEKDPFNPDFLKRWSNMKVIRFMDWMHTNGSKISDWSDRPKPTDQTQGQKGVALEYMIALCNRLHADPWFCMPHLASDDYVRNFARMVKERLEPDRRVYIEYSNECWNFIFGQTRYCLEQGKKLKLSDNEFQAALRYYSQRAVEIFKIGEEVFGGKDRLVRVLSAQGANPWTSEQVLGWQDAAKKADALAIAPYFGYSFGDPKKADEVAQLTVEQLLEQCRAEVAKERERMAKQAAVAKKFGVKLFAYEAGQHLVGHGGAENNQKLTDLFFAANRHPIMKDLYREYLGNWKAVGGDLIMIFSSTGRPSKWGSWGILEYQDQDSATAPKFQAVQEFIAGNPKQ